MTMTAGASGPRRGYAVGDDTAPLPASGAVDAERMLDAVGQAVMATDLDGTIIYWNTHAEQMYGWTAREVLGCSVMDAVVSQDLRESANDIFGALSRGEPWSGEFWVEHRDGRRFPALVTDTPVFDVDGTLAAVIGVSVDLSEQYRLEAEGRAAERRYQLGFESAAVGVGIIDLDGTCTDANPALCRLLAIDRSQIVGQHMDEFIVDRDPSRRAELVEQMVNGTWASVDGEARLRRDDGESMWVLATATLIRDERNRPESFFVQVQDITRRKGAEDALRFAELSARTALDDLVRSVARTIEIRDPYTAGHQERVAEYATDIATELDLDADEIEGIRVAATIHDLGKIAIPAEILTRPGTLTSTEFELMKAHPQTGHDIVANVAFPWPVARMVLEHHERMDGSGYPNALMGDDILMGSRIVAVADVLESVSTHRPYRPALGIAAAYQVLIDGRGTLFDADIVDACLRCRPQPLTG